MKRVVASAFLLCLLSTSPLLAVDSITTLPAWDGIQFISSFGTPNTATYGQVISLSPAGGTGVLDSFSFEIGNCNGQVDFRGHVYGWNGTNAVGPSLFDSPVQSVVASSSFQLVTISTGALTLPPGDYVLFVSTSQDQGANVACRFGSVANSAYPGGQFVFINNGTTTAQWTANPWSTIAFDLAFTAVFQNVIPTLSDAALVLLALGLLAFGFRRLRSRRAAG